MQPTVNVRSTNIELFRIIAMLAIVAHHYVVNSGLLEMMMANVNDLRTTFLLLFGMWGKTGINCFVLITGWFMCTKNISLRKYLKLLMEIIFYNFVINLIFGLTGYSSLSIKVLLRSLWPFWTVDNSFISCYLLFYLFIPFLNILIKNLKKNQHALLVFLCIGIYCILGTVPLFRVRCNYISWFIALYFLASYIRIYPNAVTNNKRIWGVAVLFSFILSIASVIVLEYGEVLVGYISRESPIFSYYFVSDSNKALALLTATCCFMWFKNISMPNNMLINRIASSSLGVLLIHANSDIMRKWLWKDVVDCVGQYEAPLSHLVISSIICVVAIFIVCTLIDQLRMYLFEYPFFRWYDKVVKISIV